MTRAADERKPFQRTPHGRMPRTAAFLFLALVLQAAAFAGETGTLSAALLTRDLGDPREPGNAKLVVALPESSGHLLASVRAADFVVHVFPEDLAETEGTADRYRAGGLYLWRYKKKLFLDVREVPRQDREGRAKVRVAFAPGGRERMSGIAEGECRFASDLVDVVLAVDVSRSMNYNDPHKRRVTAARTFLEMAGEGGGIGRVGLVTFNHRGDVRTPLLPLEESGRILRDLDQVGADGLTNLDLPLELGERMLREADSRRPVVVLLTDGKNEGARYRNTHRRLAEDGVRIFTVGLTRNADHGLLEEMADASGGIYFRAPTDDDLPEIYARLAAELGKRHLLRGDALEAAAGEGALPVDATIKRIVAITDGGARTILLDPQGAEATGRGAGGTGSVFVGRPRAGRWRYSWSGAAPGISGLAFFGDTPFFLDLFPPQYQGEQVAVGATLARGALPFGLATVWIEPLPGLPGGPFALHDDGLHDDGEAGDGVYGAVVDLPAGYRDRFDVVVRGEGELPDDGEFIRQTAGIAVRMPVEPEPEIKRFSLGGTLDFGVLYPGETGVAGARVTFEADSPETFLFDLSWVEETPSIPTLLSRVDIPPGRQNYELEVAVPADAAAGTYRGILDVRAETGLGDAKPARLVVGDVRFSDPGPADLGVIRPGREAEQVILIPYRADKETPLEISAAGDDFLSVAVDLDRLAAGSGEVALTVTASALAEAADGERLGRVVLRAGPGEREIPVAWRVRAFNGASLGGDVDFGVLFPGETGSAEVLVDLDSTRPERLFFNLSWPDHERTFQTLASDEIVPPGRQAFELDFHVPETASSGDYAGRLSVRAWNGLGDEREARLRVGTVVFEPPEAIDLGAIRPGTTSERIVTVSYYADKAAPVAVSVDGAELAASAGATGLSAGEGEMEIAVSAAAGPDAPDGVREGVVRIKAGPGSLTVPVRWRVRSFWGALLGDDVDFGVLFPGERGSAAIDVSVDSVRAEALDFRLSWPDSDGALPEFTARAQIAPGRHPFDLDIVVPSDAVPARHVGRIEIRSGDGVDDVREARLTIGDVVFADPGAVNFGEVKPGETSSRTVAAAYRADKSSPLAISVKSGEYLSALADAPALAAGEGEVGIDVSVALPPDAPDSPGVGAIRLEAGPGALEIPVYWNARGFRGATLGDDVDFGVLFPGETGVAPLSIILDSTRPERLSVRMTWPGGVLPAHHSGVRVDPGASVVDLALTAPPDARPGSHRGRVTVEAENGLGDDRPAKVVVGTVLLGDPGTVHLGVLRPGGVLEKSVPIPYRADRPVRLGRGYEGDPGVEIDAPAMLERGEGEAVLSFRAAEPADGADGGRQGVLTLNAGPASREAAVTWTVLGFRGTNLEGDIDFGIAFPGETAKAEVPLLLDSTRPEELDFSLAWPDDARFLPSARFGCLVQPGRQSLEVEAPIPADAPPGRYEGRFGIGSRTGLGDSRPARIIVGTVSFGDVEPVDMGTVPPGTFASKTVEIPYRADRGAALNIAASGDPVLTARAGIEYLPAGEGAAPVEVTVSAPIGSADGERNGLVALAAGPGFVEVPVFWTVRAYAPTIQGDGRPDVIRPGGDSPFELPDPGQMPPDLPAMDAGQYRPEAFLPDAGGPRPPTGPGVSPFDRTSRIIEDAFKRARDDRPDRFGPTPPPDRPPPGQPGIGAPVGGTAADGDGTWRPWNAWWLYLLAALLLLLLLLLLIAYLLYRSYKKALLILASIIANIILLLAFIALLSSSILFPGEARETIEVNLVEVDDPSRYGLPMSPDDSPPASVEPLEAPRDRDASGGAGSGAESVLSEMAGAAAMAGAAGAPLERPEDLPGEAEATGDLAAPGTPVATAVEMDRTSLSTPRRRERRTDRSARDLPQIAMPELAEPPPAEETDNAAAPASSAPVGDAVDVEDLVDPGRPAWSGENRGPEVRSGDPARLTFDPLEMEYVALEPALARVEPRGRGRNRSEAPSLVPEPRVMIDDPVRDETRAAAAVDIARLPNEPDFGIEETRVDSPAGGMPAPDRAAISSVMPAGSSDLPSGAEARPVEGLRGSLAEPARNARRDRQPNREEAAPPVRSPSNLAVAASGAGRNPARPAGGPSDISSGEARFDAGPGGMGDLLQDASQPGGDRLGTELADAGKPGSLFGTDPTGRVSGRDGPRSLNGRAGGASEPGARTGRGGRGDKTGDGRGNRDFGDRDGQGRGPGGTGTGDSGQTPGGGAGTPGPGGGGGTPGSGGGGAPGPGRGSGSGRGQGAGDSEGRMDDLEPYGGGFSPEPVGARIADRPASRLEGGEDESIIRFAPPGRSEADWGRGEMRQRRRRGVAPSSSVDPDALLIVVGDFARLPDQASGNLFGALAERLAPNVDVEERGLRPGDAALGDCLLGVLTPEDVDGWSDAELRGVSGYLLGGGHLWLDADERGGNDGALARIADGIEALIGGAGSGGDARRVQVRALPVDHQLADAGPADGVFIDGNLAVAASSLGWRGSWRHGGDGDREALRYLVRTLNLFLSGDANVGLAVDVAAGRDGLAVQSSAPRIPEMVIGVGGGGRIWEDHAAGSEGRWRLAPWSDRAALSSVSDGRGGRALRFDLGGAEKGRVAAYRTMSPPEDFTNVARMTVDVYYGGRAGGAAVSAIFTVAENGRWVDFETEARTLSPGWNRIEFRPAGERFRSSLNGWAGFDLRPASMERTGRLGVILYRDEKTPDVLLAGRIDLYDE
ncbi:MAG: VWA domain-containing protein [Planctomycetota bacterium]|jgi:Mg-chelatase subunit ChlD|nr:VWA domain-containing protein [Planctomycetota bacterium]